MTHVDEENWAIVQFDMIIKEYLRSLRSGETFVWLIAPFFLNYRIPNAWPSFLSNMLNVSDIDTLEDLVRMVRKNEIVVKVLTHSPTQLKKQGFDEWYVTMAIDFISRLQELGCKIFFSPTNHGKLTATSHGVLFGSANITQKGIDPKRQDNIGEFFPTYSHSSDYQKKIEWADKKFKESEESPQITN